MTEPPAPPPTDPPAEGARARALGRPRDAYPYPGDSPERSAWMEGYDGRAADRPPHPRDDACGRGPRSTTENR